MYKHVIRPILFLFKPESIHQFTFFIFRTFQVIPGGCYLLRVLTGSRKTLDPTSLLGIRFKNKIGLAAGLDKDAHCIRALDAIGFGFIEIGTLTPLPQPGNPKPRVFRLKKDSALINRMGFNNSGLDKAVQHLKKRPKGVIVGGNIGKNKWVANEEAYKDYEAGLTKLYPYVDYFVINISSPNTPNLRELQNKEPLKELIGKILDQRDAQKEKKPVLLKIAPDLSDGQLNDVIEILKHSGLDGVVATNTTIERKDLSYSDDEIEYFGKGGLSGKPLHKRSTEMIGKLRQELGNEFPIIGVGGIFSADDALEKIKAGANLVQIYTGFIYNGPGLIKQISQKLIEYEQSK